MPFEDAPPDSFPFLSSVIHHYLQSFYLFLPPTPLFLLLSYRQLESGFGLAGGISFHFNVLLDFLVLGQKPGCLTASPFCIRPCQVSPALMHLLKA